MQLTSLTFHRVSNWAELSTDGAYSVSQSGDTYQAWRTTKPPELLWTGSNEQCKQACRDHASGMNLAPELYQPGNGGGR